MKTKDEIINEIKICEELLENRKKEFNLSDKDDPLSFMWHILSKKIAELEAKIQVLYWVLR
jgi:hypothetical protein